MSGNNKKPLISIITVCQNSVDFIEQCIKSVITQKFDNYEYIIIDGKSSDGTVEIINKYNQYLTYWHSKSDRGLSHAFNIGLSHACGEWITFLNSDDYYHDKYVLSKVSPILIESENYDVIYGRIRLIGRNNNKTLYDNIGEEFNWEKFSKRSIIPHPAAFTNQNLFKEVGVYDENYRNALDYELYLRKGKKIRAKYIPYLITVMRDAGISKSTAARSLIESRNAMIKNKIHSRIFIYINYYKYLIRLIVKKYLFMKI